ncbi:MAG: hypothetical protein ACE15B_13315 [Bryobacteraceae bacterium]
MPHRSSPLLLLVLAAAAAPQDARRTDLNLQGQTDTAAGESRRNENVQFNPIDNNALKELNVRMGTTATIVQEFRADRNYFGAEFGKPVASPLYVLPAAGAGFHGSVFEGHGNSIFSARSFFQAGGVKPAHNNDYGFTLGWPVRRSFHFTGEANQQKIRGSVNGNVLVPRPDERTPLTADPALRRLIQRMLDAFPAELPNRTDVSERALNTNSPQSIDTDTGLLRAGAGRLTAEYRFIGQSVEAFQLVAGQNPNSDTKSHAARLVWTHEWTSAAGAFSAGFDRVHTRIVPDDGAFGPHVTFGGVIEQLGPGSNLPIDRAQNQFRYEAQFSRKLSGAHSWTAGFAVLRRQINGSEYSSQRGVIYFTNDFGRDAMTNFRMGAASRYSTGLGEPHRGFRNWDMQANAGDRWRVRPTLTLSYGLRYQPVTRPTEVNGLSTVAYGCQCGNLAPRFGFAWRAPGSLGVVRGAAGLHFGEIFPVTFQQVRFNPPGVIKLEIHNPDLKDPLAGADLNPGARSTIFVIPPDLSTPYSLQYNFSWEPTLAADWNLQLGYVGSRSNRLLFLHHTNRARAVPGIERTNGTVNLRRADPDHFDIRRVGSISRAYFDAARVALVVRRWRALTLDTSYWFSKAIDLGGNYTNPAANTDSGQTRSQSEFLLHQDLKGPSSFDASHAMLARASYDVCWPGGQGKIAKALGVWTVSAVLLLKTGTPFDVISGSDAPGFGNVDGSSGDRPHLLDPRVLGRTIDDPDTSTTLLPRAAFAFIRPEDERGNLGHNVFRKGGIRNVNAALARSWKVGSEKTLAFRAEAVNFFNSPQFAEPAKELTSPGFGQITNTLNDGRTFRFLLRLSF